MVSTDLLNMGGYHLLGVVSGYYYENEDFNLEIATTVKGKGPVPRVRPSVGLTRETFPLTDS